MASGNTLAVFGPQQNQPPASAYAIYGLLNNIPILVFDASTAKLAVFADFLPRIYSAGGITIALIWCVPTTATGNVVWACSFERNNSGEVVTSDSFAGEQSVTASATGTAAGLIFSEITFTNSQIDSLVAGDFLRLKVRRDASNASDTLAVDAYLIGAELRES